MRLAFGCDHAGFAWRAPVVEWAKAQGHTVDVVGADSAAAYDYPDAAEAVVGLVRNGSVDVGVLCCGTGIGMSIAANRHRGIRAAVCHTPQMAVLARAHNHANVLCLGARLHDVEHGIAILQAFLDTGPDQALRHVARIAKIDAEL